MKKKLKEAMGRIAGVAGLYRRQFRSSMTIVVFHRVNDDIGADGLTCSSAKFEAFCEFFLRYFDVVPLSQQVAGCLAGRDLGGTLSITFDDGYLDNAAVAVPILRRLKLPATFFVASAFLGTNLVPSWDRHLGCHPGWMSWNDLRTLVAQGFEIGSHTHRHVNLATTDLTQARAELETSKRTIEEELGVAPRLFAYPFGGLEHISEAARALVQEIGFDCCASCFGGVNPITADPYRLRRIGIAEWFATPDQFGFELLAGKA